MSNHAVVAFDAEGRRFFFGDGVVRVPPGRSYVRMIFLADYDEIDDPKATRSPQAIRLTEVT